MMTEIDGWKCIVIAGKRSVSREYPGKGDALAWYEAGGPLETEFRASEPDEAGDVVLPAAVVTWLLLTDAEQRGYERGLANRDERCLQSDTQRIRESLAEQRGTERERAAVVRLLRGKPAVGYMHRAADAIESGKHLEER